MNDKLLMISFQMADYQSIANRNLIISAISALGLSGYVCATFSKCGTR